MGHSDKLLTGLVGRAEGAADTTARYIPSLILLSFHSLTFSVLGLKHTTDC